MRPPARSQGNHNRDRPAAVPRHKEETDGLRAAMAKAMELTTAARSCYKLLLEMERQGALRLPFHGHRELMQQLRDTLGIRE